MYVFGAVSYFTIYLQGVVLKFDASSRPLGNLVLYMGKALLYGNVQQCRATPILADRSDKALAFSVT